MVEGLRRGGSGTGANSMVCEGVNEGGVTASDGL